MQIAFDARHAQRGQALFETAIILPVFLLVLYGVLWAVQAGVVNERVQMAVRYSGLVSNETMPYMQYSMYALYDNLEGIKSPPTTSCQAPTTDALLNNGQFPGPQTLPFWNPAGPTKGTCASGEQSVRGGGLPQPQIFTHTLSTITSSSPIQGLLAPVMGPLQNVSAQQNYLDAPPLGTVFKCYQELDDAVSQSLQHGPPSYPVAGLIPLPSILPTAPLSVNPVC
jgi:hypothetical protein